ncbi:MAG: alginate lyase family protein, partial [Deinococcota bacterium]
MPLFTQDWSQLQEKARALPWYSALQARVQARVDASIARGLEVPTKPGGWLHKYVCQDTWLPLRYDPSNPTQHRSLLGKVYTGEPFEGGWRVWRHRELADAARDAACLFKLQDNSTYAQAVSTILLDYATKYQQFAGDEDAEAWMTKGRAFNQALSEAIWAVPLIQAFDMIQDSLPTAHHTEIIEQLLYPIARTLSRAHDSLIAQDKVKSNYVAWLIAALGSIGFSLQDTDLIDRSIDGPGGFKAHVDASILADGFQYEVTPYYHNFVALALSQLAEAALSNGINLYSYQTSQGTTIASMWEAFVVLSQPNGSIVELNDGSYWQESIYDTEICDVYEVALARQPHMHYAQLLQQAYARRGTPRDRWTALLFAKHALDDDPQDANLTPKQHTTHLASAGVVMLTTPTLSACLPYGNYAGSHSHLDRLSLNIWPFSQDAGTPLYGIPARVSWYQQTLAHNTIVVDGQSQAQGGGYVTSSSDSSLDDAICLHADTLYSDVNMSRIVNVDEDALVDKFCLQSDSDHNYDWLCHTDGEWQLTHPDGISFEELQQSYSDYYNDDDNNQGAGVFVDLTARAHIHTDLIATTTYQGQTFQLELSANQPLELLLATCPGRSQHPHQKRHLLIARIYGKSAQYMARYKALDPVQQLTSSSSASMMS